MENASVSPASDAIVVSAIDGLASLECGIGSIVQWFFEELDEIKQRVPALAGSDWALYAISPRLSESSSDYSPRINSLVEKACQRQRGEFIWLNNETAPSLAEIWAHDDQAKWDVLSRLLADKVRELSRRHRRVTVLVHGVMLVDVRVHLADLENVQVVYFTHSLGLARAADSTRESRVHKERRAFAAMSKNSHDRVAYIGANHIGMLREQYGLHEENLAPFVNGIPERSFRFSAEAISEDREQVFKANRIPVGKRIVFAWGRCHPQKGFDVLAPAYGEFISKAADPDWHLVLLAPSTLANAEYSAEVRGHLDKLPPGSWTLIEAFDPLLPHRLLRDAAVEVVVFASRFEGAPLTVLEALRFGHRDLRIAWHDIPAISQFLGGREGCHSFPALTVPETAAALLAAAQETSGKGIDSFPSFAHNTAAGLKETLRWWGTDGLLSDD